MSRQLSQHVTQSNHFIGKLDTVKDISLLLKAIHFKECATLFFTDKGFKVTVEDNKCVQASAFIPSELFQTYRLIDDLSIRISITALIEALNIFGSTNTAVKMCCRDSTSPLSLLLEEGGVVTDCSLNTLEPEYLLDLPLINPPYCRAVLNASMLKEVFGELDTSSEYIEISWSLQSPNLSLATKGSSGFTQIDIPKESEKFEAFECQNNCTFKYRYAHVKPALKPLSASSKVALRLNEGGLLCLQYVVSSDNSNGYIEFFCIPGEND